MDQVTDTDCSSRCGEALWMNVTVDKLDDFAVLLFFQCFRNPVCGQLVTFFLLYGVCHLKCEPTIDVLR
jgi:hypothetical protein